MKIRNRRIGLIIILLFLVLVFLFTFLSSTEKTVLKLDKKDIGHEEYEYWINRNKNSVISKYFSQDDQIDWNKEVNGRSISSEVYLEAIDSILYTNSIWDISKDLGLIAESTFESAKSRMELENISRKEMIENNEIVYGLEEFNFDQYVEYELDHLLQEIKGSNEFDFEDVTEEEIIDRYEKDKDLNYRNNPDIEVKYLQVDTFDLSNQEINNLYKNMLNIKKSLDNGEDFEDILFSYPNLKDSYSHRKILASDIRGEYRANEHLYQTLNEVKIGGVSDVKEYPGFLFMVEYVDSKDNGYLEIDDVKAIIRDQIAREKLDEYIDEKVEDIEFEILVDDIEEYTVNILEEVK